MDQSVSSAATYTVIILILMVLVCLLFIALKIISGFRFEKKVIETLQDNPEIETLLNTYDNTVKKIKDIFNSHQFIEEKEFVKTSTLIYYMRKTIKKKRAGSKKG